MVEIFAEACLKRNAFVWFESPHSVSLPFGTQEHCVRQVPFTEVVGELEEMRDEECLDPALGQGLDDNEPICDGSLRNGGHTVSTMPNSAHTAIRLICAAVGGTWRAAPGDDENYVYAIALL
ncbi:hypothetical protein FJ970_02950 [Mesorhizobium sp. B2-1-8]|uniref:hypothetical protein n=1 Tax=Mesorhizobium sp. B2-1-8 TaxID=2589967 RepID=UPI001128D6AE|nr:hypothetical protein [Mesorhizobium sp. B2-1-8]UCI19944.1 hypothetical protein FJ970_02950 [Mesorhizobium sp. B2-1-8]